MSDKVEGLWVGISDRVFNYHAEFTHASFKWADSKENGVLGAIEDGEIEFISDDAWEAFTDGGHLNARFFVEAASLVASLTPTSSLQVLFDRWRDGDPTNNIPFRSCEQDERRKECEKTLVISYDPTRTHPGKYFGGDIKGFEETIPYVSALGFDAVWSSPLWKNARGMAKGSGSYAENYGISGYHGYWGMDFCKIDEHLGTRGHNDEDVLKELKVMAEGAGIMLQVDLIMNHAGPRVGTFDAGKIKCGKQLKADYWSEHMALNLLSSEYDYNPSSMSVFNHTPNINRWEFRPAQDSSYYTERQDGTLADLADLNVEHNRVAQSLIGASTEIWTRHAHGARIDTLFYVPEEFVLGQVEDIRTSSKSYRLIVGEWFDALHKEDLYDAGLQKYVTAVTDPDRQLDLFDFGFHYAAHDAFGTEDGPLSSLVDHLKRLSEHPISVLTRLSPFVDNHDMPLLLNRYEWPKADQLHQALAASFMLPGVPYVYGQDLMYVYDKTWKRGLFGIGGDPMNRGMVNPPVDKPHFFDMPVARLVKRLNEFRKNNMLALRFGSFSGGFDGGDFGDEHTVAIKREFGEWAVLYLHVRGTNDIPEVDWPDGTYSDQLTNIKYKVTGGRINSIPDNYYDPVWDRWIKVDEVGDLHMAESLWKNSATGNMYYITNDRTSPPDGIYLPHSLLENDLCNPEKAWSDTRLDAPWEKCAKFYVVGGRLVFEDLIIDVGGLEEDETYELPGTGWRFRRNHHQPILADGRYRMTNKNGVEEVLTIRDGMVELLPSYKTIILAR
jgi:glycosidase